MLRTLVIAGASAAAVLGVGTAALATSGSVTVAGTAASSTPSPAGSGRSAAGRGAAARMLLRRAAHADVVVHTPAGYVRHVLVAGKVTAVSAQQIHIRAEDGYVRTFAITGQTVVRRRANGTASASSISAVHVGDTAAVMGREPASSTAPVPARVIVDGIRSR